MFCVLCFGAAAFRGGGQSERSSKVAPPQNALHYRRGEPEVRAICHLRRFCARARSIIVGVIVDRQAAFDCLTCASTATTTATTLTADPKPARPAPLQPNAQIQNANNDKSVVGSILVSLGVIIVVLPKWLGPKDLEPDQRQLRPASPPDTTARELPNCVGSQLASSDSTQVRSELLTTATTTTTTTTTKGSRD